MKRPPSPFVFLNLAMSADGKIATANHAVYSVGSARDLAHLYELRATADAIMCGARTVEIPGATLGNGGAKFDRRRLRRNLAAHPLRIIVSGGGSIDPGAKIFQNHFAPLILLTTQRAPKRKLMRLQPGVDEIKIFDSAEIDFPAALRWLGEKWRVKRLLCEGGGELNGALLRAGLVDEIHLTICPRVIGGRGAATAADGEGLGRLADAAAFKLSAKRAIRGELFTVFSRAQP